MGKLTLKQSLERLDWSMQLFSVQNLHKTANEIKKMKKEIQDKKNPVTLDYFFKVLQTTFVVEYNSTPHRIQCSNFFKKRYNAVKKINIKGLNKRTLNKNWLDSMNQRATARKAISTLDGILIKGMKSDSEKAIGISYDYLAHIDGMYGKDLKDVVIYDMLSNMESVNFNKIKKMGIQDIQCYFDGIRGSSCLFEGYNADIRNSIAHSSFWYDEKKKKIIFEERRKNHTHEKTLDDLFEMKEKLSDIEDLVFCYNEIQTIDKVVSDLIRI